MAVPLGVERVGDIAQLRGVQPDQFGQISRTSVPSLRVANP